MAIVERSNTYVGNDESILLSDIPWEVYEALRDVEANSAKRMTYDEGWLEIMSPGGQHEGLRTQLGRMLETLTEELNIPIRSAGATTWRRKRRRVGLEPDESYYIQNESRVRRRKFINEKRDRPPDLAIEVEVSNEAIGKLPLYARLGIAEVWRCDGKSVVALRLSPEGEYVATKRSVNLPFLDVGELGRWLATRGKFDETTWIRRYRAWVRKKFAKPER